MAKISATLRVHDHWVSGPPLRIAKVAEAGLRQVIRKRSSGEIEQLERP